MENNQTTDIIIDDGKQTYNIKNQNGELLGSFRMNPADMSILERFKSVENVLENITEHVDMNKDFEEVEKEMSAIVREQINYLFDCDCADVLFGITSPFTIMKNGEFFLEQVIVCSKGEGSGIDFWEISREDAVFRGFRHFPIQLCAFQRGVLFLGDS